MKSSKFSRFVFGAWRLADVPAEANATAVAKKITDALELGITTFDHADIYGDYRCEELFGEAMVRASIPRDSIQLISKCGIKLVSANRPSHRIKTYDTSKAHIIASAEQSLRNLKTDFLDLLLIHRPDPLMHPEDIADAFSKLEAEGKVKSFGVSNFTASQCRMLQSAVKKPLQCNQIEMSLFHLDAFYNGQLDLCLENGMIPMAWSPLAGGRLLSATDARSLRIRECLAKMAKKYQVTHLETIAYAWLLAHPSKIYPVIGTGKRERMQAAMMATDMKIERDDWYEILKASVGYDVP